MTRAANKWRPPKSVWADDAVLSTRQWAAILSLNDFLVPVDDYVTTNTTLTKSQSHSTSNGSADLYVFGSRKNTEGYHSAPGSRVIFRTKQNNPKSDSGACQKMMAVCRWLPACVRVVLRDCCLGRGREPVIFALCVICCLLVLDSVTQDLYTAVDTQS